MFMSHRGLFVVLEGIDGAGTTTNAKMLVEWFTSRGRRAWFTSEPTKGPVGIIIRRKLREKAFNDPVLETLLFAADRAWHLRREIVPRLKEGYMVVCDRYYESSVAYQGAQGASQEWILRVNEKFPEPDLTILLDIEPLKALQRIHNRAVIERFESASFLSKVREIYLERAREKGYEVINADRPMDKVQESVRELVLKLLSG